MTFTLTLNPDELDGTPWADNLEVRLYGTGNLPGSDDAVHLLRRTQTFDADTYATDGLWSVPLPASDVWAHGYEARYGVQMPWTFVPSQASGSVNLAGLYHSPVVPPPEPDVVAAILARLAALEAGGGGGDGGTGPIESTRVDGSIALGEAGAYNYGPTTPRSLDTFLGIVYGSASYAVTLAGEAAARPSLPADATDGQTATYNAGTGLWVATNPSSGGGVGAIHGTGFPEGAVTAPVGTEYVDDAATNGAVKWIKATGTGNTGWRVVFGDTGWRNILASWRTAAGISGMLYALSIKRTHAGVYVNAYVYAEGTDATSGTGFLPAGFTPDVSTLPSGGFNYVSQPLASNSPNPNIPATTSVRAGTDGSLRFMRSNGSEQVGQVLWLPSTATTPWPTTLPGTPA